LRPPEITIGLYIITATCGLIDAVCFLALGGVFAEMMTGNLLLLSLSLGSGKLLGEAARYISAILAFTVGAVLGGRLLRLPDKWKDRRIGFACQWLIVLGATIVTALTAPTAGNDAGHLVVDLLALAMGVQNAMVRAHGVPDLATNVMTLTYAALVSDSRLAGGSHPNWHRRITSVALFCLGAALGAFLLRLGPVYPLALSTLLLGIAQWPLLLGKKPA
jgi:uncharacterized membrane protein YoaK (UPF0700 family)